MSVISVRDLTIEYRRPQRVSGRFGALRSLVTNKYAVKRAVDSVSFEIDRAELVGYLGPNGAGKSTTIKALTGILTPTSGTVEVGGLTPWRDREANARQIGVVFGQRTGLWWDLPLRDSLRLIHRIYEVPAERYRVNLGRLDAVLGLSEFLDTPVRQLSLGQRMRGDLAAAMLYEPRVLFLDEPTIGLDIVAKEQIRSFVAELKRDYGTTVVLTTHDLDDVELLCDRIILIDQGHVLYDGEVEKLKNRYAPHRELVVHLRDSADHVEPADLDIVSREKNILRLRFDPRLITAAEIIGRVTARYEVADLSLVEPSLEGVISRIYAGKPT